MDTQQFALAVVALLLVPGPTNTLLATSAATVGFRRSLPLLLGELAAYNITIGLLRGLFAGAFAAHAYLVVAVRVLAAAYLASVALRLLRVSLSHAKSPVSVARVFVTTLLNPKGMIVALVLMPIRAATGQWIVFSLLVPVIAVAWISAGHLLSVSASGRITAAVPKVASLVLAGFACALIATSIRGVT